MGDINWLCPSLHISTGQLKTLFDILKGDTSPTSPLYLTTEASESSEGFARGSFNIYGLFYVIFLYSHAPIGVFWEDGQIFGVGFIILPLKIKS